MGPKNVYVRKKDVEKREEVNERKREKVLKKERGITLIALMITIIVLLILAAVTLNLALGERGIFKTASDAKIKTERAEIIEKAKLDIVDVQTGNMGKFTESELIEILNKYGALSDNGEETIIDKTLTSKDGKHEIKVSEIWNVPFENTIPKGKIKFNISGLNYTSYNGEYEVENGTTWEEFINATFPNNCTWVYIVSTNELISNVEETSARLYVEWLCDSNGNKVKKNDIIIER